MIAINIWVVDVVCYNARILKWIRADINQLEQVSFTIISDRLCNWFCEWLCWMETEKRLPGIYMCVYVYTVAHIATGPY